MKASGVDKDPKNYTHNLEKLIGHKPECFFDGQSS